MKHAHRRKPAHTGTDLESRLAVSSYRYWLSTSNPDPLPTPHQWQQLEDAVIGHDASQRDGSPTGMRILRWLSDHPGEFHEQALVAPLVRLGVAERNERAAVRATAVLSLPLLDLIADRTGRIGFRDRDRRRLTRYFQEEGFLDADLHWLDPTDWSRGSKASWLLLEHATVRLATAQAEQEDSA